MLLHKNLGKKGHVMMKGQSLSQTRPLTKTVTWACPLPEPPLTKAIQTVILGVMNKK